jgi:hypothetical protein
MSSEVVVVCMSLLSPSLTHCFTRSPPASFFCRHPASLHLPSYHCFRFAVLAFRCVVTCTHVHPSTQHFAIPPRCMLRRSCLPPLKRIYLSGHPLALSNRADKGELLGKFLTRSGGPEDLSITKGWPGNILEEILNSNRASSMVFVPSFALSR